MKSLLHNVEPGLRKLMVIVLVICLAWRGQAQNSDQGFFSSDEIVEITLKTDLKNLIKKKRDDKYQPAEFIVNGKSYAIRLKARGAYRLENCSFPPITLNFSKTDFEDKSYDQLKKLKLVNACKMQSTYEQYILREYLIYRTFNLMTDKSFKVRLLKIEYLDANNKIKPANQYGFVIEDQHMMAERLDGILIKRTGLNDKFTNRDQIVMLSIFQFMIGNTDWQVASLQNLKMLKLNDVSEPAPYVIPYDFDYTGMVNATYAIPAPILGIDNIRERLFWGKCYTDAELLAAIEKLLEKKADIYKLYEDFTLFNQKSHKLSISYLDSFYKIIENEKSWKYFFIDKCKN